MRKPKLFIGSSVEGLNVAYAIQDNLKHTIECTVWDQGVFNLSETSLESLIKTLNKSDFGVFVFTPDDYVIIRGESNSAVRDNVIFELGLFVGRLGRERSFIIVPDNKEFHLPTDLIGITPAKYEATRSDNNTQAGTGSASNLIRNAIRDLGLFDKSESSNVEEGITIAKKDENQDESWVKYYWIDKNYDLAIKKISQEIEKEKDSIKKLNLLGYLCDIEYNKNTQVGMKKFEEFITKNSTNTVAYQHFASTLMKKNLTSQALEIIEDGLKKCNDKISLSIMKADLLSSIDKNSDAIEFLNEQKALLNSPEIHSKLALLLEKSGKKDEALLEFLYGYRLDPINEKLLFEFAKISYNYDNKKVSLLLYKDLLKIDNENPTYWTLLGNVYLELDFYDSALESYLKANELSEDNQGWILANIGNLYNNKQLFSNAEKYLNKSLNIEKKSDYTLEKLSQVYKNSKEEKEKINQILKDAKIILNNEFKEEKINFDDL